ncbi:hypothetical protein [Methanosphaerula subterraneus]|uniref:hypothetical protein n=1 Tax=Methanosphaerula subterraneus TaxID=3350244 RepID=UPI003F876E0F
MFIGHFAVAYLLLALFPSVPPLVLLIGVSLPDLLWPVLVFCGVEKVEVDPISPLVKDVSFLHYPYSHSLVIGGLIACLFGAVVAYLFTPLAGALFVAAAISHWLLDLVMHRPDLPVLGFGSGDRKLGYGLWDNQRAAFAFEFLLYVVVTVLAMPIGLIVPLLILGTVFHLINANAFFGFVPRRANHSPKVDPAMALIGFTAFIVLANTVILYAWF